MHALFPCIQFKFYLHKWLSSRCENWASKNIGALILCKHLPFRICLSCCPLLPSRFSLLGVFLQMNLTKILLILNLFNFLASSKAKLGQIFTQVLLLLLFLVESISEIDRMNSPLAVLISASHRFLSGYAGCCSVLLIAFWWVAIRIELNKFFHWSQVIEIILLLVLYIFKYPKNTVESLWL